jgi:hypothetical protein
MPSSTKSDRLPSADAYRKSLSHPLFDSSGDKTTLSQILNSLPSPSQTSTHPTLGQVPRTPTTPTTPRTAASTSTSSTLIANPAPSPPSEARVLVVFIRNFLCGLCQQYILALSDAFGPTSDHPLQIVVIGCGAPSLIESYQEITQCPWGIYTDPSAELYKVLGMKRTLSTGSFDVRPTYLKRGLVLSGARSVVQGLRRVGTGRLDAVSGAGEMNVVGGEFLLELMDVKALEGSDVLGEWTVRWCRRMENTRDHTEIHHLKIVLGMESARDEGIFRKEEADEAPPMLRRSTTSKIQRTLSLSMRIQGLGLGRSRTLRMEQWRSGSEKGLGRTVLEVRAVEAR